MELSIRYECSECRQTLVRRLVDLSPGQFRQCGRCGAQIILPPGALQELQQDLKEYCRS